MGYHPRRLLKDLIPAKKKKCHNVQPAPSSSRTAHSCNSHEAFEGSVPDLHSSSLLRVQRASRAWTCLRTRSQQRCLQPGFCQRWLCDPGQARPCVHRIPSLFSGTSRRPPPLTQFTRSVTLLGSTQAATSTTSTTLVSDNSCPTTPPSTSTRVTLALDSRLPTSQSEFKGILKP